MLQSLSRDYDIHKNKIADILLWLHDTLLRQMTIIN